MIVKKSRLRVWIAAAPLAAILLVGAFWALRSTPDPRDFARNGWADRGVDRPNILLVTLDTTRADHLCCYGYPLAKTPVLDALARGGVLFTQASAVAPLTQPAHSSIMTGMYPTHHGVHVNGNAA